MNLWRKMFSLSDLRYSWLLLLSMVLCGLFFYLDRASDTDDPVLLSAGYTASFAAAVIWSAANYVGHIRINALYRKQHDIEAYVDSLAMHPEEKLELRNYLEDYAQDLMSQGLPPERAVSEAISQFKVKELLSLSKNSSLFQMHAHDYLLGWAAAGFAAMLLVWLANGLGLPRPLPMLVVETVLFAYSAALVLLYLIYKLWDAFLDRAWSKHIS